MRRGVVAVILIVQLIVMRFQPVGFFHLQPRAECAQAKLQHPLRLVTFRRNGAHDLFVDAFRQLVSLQLREETLFIVEVSAAPVFTSLVASVLRDIVPPIPQSFRRSRIRSGLSGYEI